MGSLHSVSIFWSDGRQLAPQKRICSVDLVSLYATL
jgi:hypothetical protein